MRSRRTEAGNPSAPTTAARPRDPSRPRSETWIPTPPDPPPLSNSALCRAELSARTPPRRSHCSKNLAREGEGALRSETWRLPILVSSQPHVPCAPAPPTPPEPRTHRYTTGMGASMNSRLASSGERRQVRGGKAGWARRPVGSQEGPVRCAGGRPSPTSGTPSGAGSFGAIGFWSHKGERREERQKSLPALRTSGEKAGRARGLGRAAGRRVGRGEEIALGRGEPWTPPHGGETPRTPKLTRSTHTPSLILPPCPSRHRPSANGSLPPAPGITCRSAPSECGEHL